MKKNRRIFVVTTFASALAAFMAAGASTISDGGAVWAGRGDHVDILAAEGATVTQTGPMHVVEGGELDKLGPGTFVLPRSCVVQTNALTINVREGRLKLTAGAAVTAIPAPSAILSRAALWLDATRNVVEDGDGNVLEWRDSRETQTTVPFDYPHGIAYNGGTLQPVRTVDANNRAAVDFNGYGSKCALTFLKPSVASISSISASLASIPCRDIFIVHSCTRSTASGDYGAGYGFLLGGNNMPFHPSDAGVTFNKRMIRTEMHPQDSRWWLNGAEFDPSGENTRPGAFVFDTRHYGRCSEVHSLYYYTKVGESLNSRNGGDLMHEVILFTNALTEVEHAQVRRYLTDRWNLTPAGTAPLTIALAAGTELEVEGDLAGVTVTGEGKIVKRAGEACDLAYVKGTMAARWLDLVTDDPAPACVHEDVTVAAAAGVDLVADNEDCACVRQGRTTGTARQLVKTGAGRSRIEALPAGVTNLVVAAGTLELTPFAALGAGPVPGGITEAAITNAGFEQQLPNNRYFTNMKVLDGRELGGWTWSFTPGWSFSDSYSVIGRFPPDNTQWYAASEVPEGTQYMAIRSQSQVSAPVEVPLDGVYELSFAVWRAKGFLPLLSVLAGVDTNHLEMVGGVTCYDYDHWRYVKLPAVTLKAGTAAIALRSDVYYPDAETFARTTLMVDDLHLRLKSAPDGSFPIPNGTFEDVVKNEFCVRSYTNSAYFTGRPFDARNIAAGWTFTQDPDFDKITAGIAILGENVSGAEPFANGAICAKDNGYVNLLLLSTAASAQTTFTAPAGKWRLRADVAPWRKNNWVDTVKNTSTVGGLAATVAVDGGAAVSLGTVQLPWLASFVGTWGTAFTVPAGGAQVTLTLRSTNMIGAIADNLVLVPADDSGTELVRNGDFEDATAWTFLTPGKEEGGTFARVRAARASITTDVTHYHSPGISYSGTVSGYNAEIADCGMMCQDVTFPAPGRYRLSYYSSTRYNENNQDLNLALLYYSRNPIRVQIAAGGVTNVIDQITPVSTNWMANSVVFTVPEAKTYSLSFQGMNVPTRATALAQPGCWDKVSFIDGVSIRKVDDATAEKIELPEDLRITVAEGAKLRLGFEGTNEVAKVVLGGRSAYGFISRATHPDFVYGEGVLFTKTPGTFIILR